MYSSQLSLQRSIEPAWSRNQVFPGEGRVACSLHCVHCVVLLDGVNTQVCAVVRFLKAFRQFGLCFHLGRRFVRVRFGHVWGEYTDHAVLD